MIGPLLAAVGALWVAIIIWDAFETVVLPRRVARRLRPTRAFYRLTWAVWSAVARRMRPGGRRETYLSFFGPLSLLVLLAAWAASLVTAFAMLQTGLRAPLGVPGGARSPITSTSAARRSSRSASATSRRSPAWDARWW